jgi:peptidoglycan hydrolase CwlO-like protein
MVNNDSTGLRFIAQGNLEHINELYTKIDDLSNKIVQLEQFIKDLDKMLNEKIDALTHKIDMPQQYIRQYL